LVLLEIVSIDHNRNLMYQISASLILLQDGSMVWNTNINIGFGAVPLAFSNINRISSPFHQLLLNPFKTSEIVRPRDLHPCAPGKCSLAEADRIFHLRRGSVNRTGNSKFF